MNLSSQVFRMKQNLAGNDRGFHWPLKPNYLLARLSVIIARVITLFNRHSCYAYPTEAPPSMVTINAVDQTTRTFTAKESLKYCDDVVVFNGQLYKWRDRFNVQPAFIALRQIEIGEDVISNPEDLERSDLMLHWSLTGAGNK